MAREECVRVLQTGSPKCVTAIASKSGFASSYSSGGVGSGGGGGNTYHHHYDTNDNSWSWLIGGFADGSIGKCSVV